MSESVLRIKIDSRNAELNARNLSRELNSIEKNGDFATKSMDSMSVATRNLAGYMAGIVNVSSAINKMDTYTGINNKLKLVTKSQTELNQAMSDTFGIAQKTAATWDSVAMVYQRFADNADRLGISMKTTAELTETVSKAISVSGGSAASAEAALMQFGQALASGVLRGEEFNSIAEQAPGLLKAIAFGLDTNVGALRAMAADGKITGDVLVDALGKAKPYIDDLFNKTDFTIAQSFTQLSNEVTKFVGAAGAGSGAAAGLSGAISGLAENLATIANIAVVGGVALLTKTILAQTVAVYGSITASALRRKDMLADLANQAAASAAEVRRTAALAQYTTMQLADSKATAARMTGMQRLAYIQATVIPLEAKATQATAAHTATTAADTVVQNANNAARSRGAMIFNAAGGWVGVLTIGVAALAAGYMYLKNRTAEANAKLEEQGKVALETDESLKKLSGNDKISAVENLTTAFDDQNKKLAESKESVDAVLFAIRAASVENEKARKVTEDARRGIISYDEAIKLLNKEKIPTDLYDQLKKQSVQYDENSAKASRSKDVLKIFGIEVKLTGNAAQNAAAQHDAQANAIDGVASAAAKASKELQDYQRQLNTDNLSNMYETSYMEQGYSPAQAKALVDAQKAIGLDSGILSKDQIDNALKSVAIAEKRNQLEDSFNQKTKSSNKAAKELATQQKKDAKDLEQSIEDAKSLIYDYTSEFIRIETDLNNEIARINEAALKSNSKSRMIADATEISEARKKLYTAELDFELNQHKMSDAEKLKSQISIDKLRIDSTKGFLADERTLKKNVLDELQTHELALIKFAKEERMFQAEQAMMTEIQRVKKRYQLERDEIIKTTADLEERTRKLNALNENTIRDGVGKNFSDPNDDNSQFLRSVSYGITPQTNTEKLDEENARVLQKLTDNLNAVKNAENVSYEERLEAKRVFDEAKEQLDDEYYFKAQEARKSDHENQLQLYGQMLSQASGVWGDMTSMIGEYKDESSKTYKAMFLGQQLFAMGSALLSTHLAAAQVMADPTALTLAQKTTYSKLILGMGYTNVGLIGAQTIAGFAGGGKIRGAGTPTSDSIPIMASDEEYMVRAYAAEKLGTPTMNYINKYGELPQNTHRVGIGAVNAISSNGSASGASVVQPKVIINNYSSEKVETSMNSDGELMVTIGKMLDQKIDSGVDRGIQRNLRQGHPLAKAIKGR